MKKLLISMCALAVCLCMILSGCKSKPEAETTDSSSAPSASQVDATTAPESTTGDSTETEAATEPVKTEKVTSAAPSAEVNNPVKVTEPKVETVKIIDSYSWNGDGTYKCGNDSHCLVPGEYYIVRSGSAKCSVSITNGSGYGISREIGKDTLVTLNSGYTLSVTDGKFIHSSKASPGPDSSGIYTDGIYKVGRDIPAGEYIARKSSSAPYNAGFTFRKSTDYFSGESLDMRHVDTPIYITLEAGEYVEIVYGSLEKASGTPIASANKDGSYSSGMYKVGIDLPAGRYMLIPNSATTYRMYNIYSDSLYNSSSLIKSETALSSTVELRLKNGQYIEFIGCKLMPAIDSADDDSSTTAP